MGSRLWTGGDHVEPPHHFSLPLPQPSLPPVRKECGETTQPAFNFLTRTLQIPSVEVEDDNESAGTRWRNTTTTATTETPGIYYEEHPQHYPHQLIMKLLQNFTAVPGLFDTGENRDLLRVVHHNNLDVDLEILK